MENHQERTYEEAVRLLRGRCRPKDDIPVKHKVPSVYGMMRWLESLGHTENDLKKLNIVHITGTKGKGSTCVFLKSFLRAHGQRTGFPQKVGLYTSPHLTHIRERIQINDQPISEGLFVKYFFELWDCLIPHNESIEEGRIGPRFLQYLCLLAFHVFIKENVDAAIFEVHNGGRLDSTNVIPHPVATGITPIGMDHLLSLGPTIERIAWHKSGILKTGSPAFSARQDLTPTAVLETSALEKGVLVTYVPVSQLLPTQARAIEVPVQRENCSLALALAQSFLRRTAPTQEMTTEDIHQGVDNFSWPGRFEVKEDQDGLCKWFIDGAHNEMSLEIAARWFALHVPKITGSCRLKILIFSFPYRERGAKFIRQLTQTLHEHDVQLDHVILTTIDERKDKAKRFDHDPRRQDIPFEDLSKHYSGCWSESDPRVKFHSEPTIEEALDKSRGIATEAPGAQVLVTGNIYLVGGALNLLGMIASQNST